MKIFLHQNFKRVLLVFFLLLINIAFSQKSTTTHKVALGDNLESIAKKYNVSVNDILEVNPDAKNALKLNSVIIIPTNTEKISNAKTYVVKSKETLYSISKKYKLSINDLVKFNPVLKTEELQVDQVIFLSENNNVAPSKIVIHEVLPKETKYSISKKYNISIENLEKQNPEIIDGLNIGTILKITVDKSYINLENKSATTDNVVLNNSSDDEVVNNILSRAQSQINTKYVNGGTNSNGFDCSGLVIYSFDKSGIQLPRTSIEQSKQGKIIEMSDAKPGDLIFFGTNGVGQINHVGIITEVNFKEIKFIHSTLRSGVIISSTDESYYKKDFVQINRVLDL